MSIWKLVLFMSLEKNKVKSTILRGLIISIVIIGLSGCSLFDRSVDSLNQYKDVHDQAKMVCSDVISCFENGNKQDLYNMFSQVQKDNIDIMAQLDEMFDKLQPQDLNYDCLREHEDGGGQEYREGSITRYSIGYIIEGITDKDDNQYVISYGYTMIDNEHPNYIGFGQFSVYRVEYIDELCYQIVENYTVGDSSLHRR